MQIESPSSRIGMYAIPDHAEVAERYRTAESTVRYWRHLEKGPRGIKIGKRVLYPEAELLRYERALIDGGEDWGLAS